MVAFAFEFLAGDLALDGDFDLSPIGDFLAGVPDRDPALDALLEGLFEGALEEDLLFGFDEEAFLAA